MIFSACEDLTDDDFKRFSIHIDGILNPGLGDSLSVLDFVPLMAN